MSRDGKKADLCKKHGQLLYTLAMNDLRFARF